MEAHSSILAWKILWTEEPCRLQSMGSGRVGQDSDFMSLPLPWWSSREGSSLPPSAAAAAKSLQTCPSLCDPIDCSPPIPGILQARTLEWVAISFSNA